MTPQVRPRTAPRVDVSGSEGAALISATLFLIDGLQGCSRRGPRDLRGPQQNPTKNASMGPRRAPRESQHRPRKPPRNFRMFQFHHGMRIYIYIYVYIYILPFSRQVIRASFLDGRAEIREASAIFWWPPRWPWPRLPGGPYCSWRPPIRPWPC